MEFYLRVVFLSHFESPGTLRQVDQVTVFVPGQIPAPSGFELLKSFVIVAGDPAGLVQVDRLVTAFGTVFMFQAVLNDIKLERPYCTDDSSSTGFFGKKLSLVKIRKETTIAVEMSKKVIHKTEMMKFFHILRKNLHVENERIQVHKLFQFAIDDSKKRYKNKMKKEQKQ